MSISRKELAKKLFSIVYDRFKSLDRLSNFELDKVYINYSEEEKNKSNNVSNILSEKVIPNEFFISYGYKETKDLYFLVSGNDKFNNEDIIIENASVVDLLILCKEGCLQIANNISEEELYNRLCIYEDEEYFGHTYNELFDLFKPFSLYKLNSNSVLSEKHLHCGYAYYMLCKSEQSDFPWEKDTLQKIENVIFSESDKIPYYNIILSLSSRQWRHIFLESYRMIEHLFAVIFLKKVSENTRINSMELARTFEDVLNWRPPEEEAIKRIFDEIEENFSNDNDFKEIIKLKAEKAGEEKLYRWYYKEIRNQIAHFRVVHTNIEFSDKEWNLIIRFNFLVIEYLYETYNDYIAD